MANPTNFPGDVVIPGDLRLTGSITPAVAKAAILAVSELQKFTVPMSDWREQGVTAMTPGSGISQGTGTICNGTVTREGGLRKTEIFIDLTGLKSGTDIGDIIGTSAKSGCYIGQITTALNGTIVYGQITCLETPATGDPDVDFYGTVTEATGTQDAAISGLTGEAQLLNNGDWTAAVATPIALTTLPGAGYLYMVDGGGTAAEYTAGQFLLELWGTADSLDYISGTHGTNAPALVTPDFGGNGGVTTYYARAEIPLPWDYVAASTVKIRVHAGMLTTVSNSTCTLDMAVYKSDEDSTSTGDLNTLGVQNMNSLTFADFDFTITATSLSPGDMLDVLLSVGANDDTDAGVMKGCIGAVKLLCDVR